MINKEDQIKSFVEDTLRKEFGEQLVEDSVTPNEVLEYTEIQKDNTINQINDYINWKTKQVQDLEEKVLTWSNKMTSCLIAEQSKELSKLPEELNHDKIKSIAILAEKLSEEYNTHFGMNRKTQGEVISIP